MYTTSDRVRFMVKVAIQPNGCWHWQGARHGQGRGYGKFHLGGRTLSAHKAGYLLFEGPVAPGQVLGHQCNDERCCYPKHVQPESQSANMQYCVASGRHSSQKARAQA